MRRVSARKCTQHQGGRTCAQHHGAPKKMGDCRHPPHPAATPVGGVTTEAGDGVFADAGAKALRGPIY
jgi:hypothetical protein